MSEAERGIVVGRKEWKRKFHQNEFLRERKSVPAC